MRSIFCIIALLIYTAGFDLYIYELPRPYIPVEYCKIFYNVITALMLAFCLTDSRNGIEGNWHKDFNLICNVAMIINFSIIVVGYFGWVKDSFSVLILSNSAIFIVSLFVLFSGTRHGEFK